MISQHEPRHHDGTPRAIARLAVARYRAQHVEAELGTLLHIMDGMHIRSVLEIGTADGGSAWAWCQLPAVTQVVTVDIRPPDLEFHRLPWAELPITWVTGNSTDPDTVTMVAGKLGGHLADMLFIDGDHTGARPHLDYMLYHGLVRSGGLIVIHDTQGYPGRDDFTVPALWADLAVTGPHLELVTNRGGPGGTGILWT